MLNGDAESYTAADAVDAAAAVIAINNVSPVLGDT